jgi:hypothetical protein
MKKAKEEKELIKKSLGKSFSKEDCVECYFIKMSKELQGHQHKIIFKTRKKISKEKIKQAEENLKIEIDKSIELSRWSDIIGKILPRSAVYKIPFFDSRSIKVYSPWRICPIGYHWVRKHDRQKKTIEDVDPHCRKNPSNKDPKKGLARGVMQIIESTVREMKGKDKDYRDYFIDLEYEDHFDPNKSIAAGVRHLFRKREIARSKLKREPTWFEVIMDYKGMLKSKTVKSEEIRENLRKYLFNMGTKI